MFIDIIQAIFILLLVLIKEIRNIISNSLDYSNKEFDGDDRKEDGNFKGGLDNLKEGEEDQEGKGDQENEGNKEGKGDQENEGNKEGEEDQEKEGDQEGSDGNDQEDDDQEDDDTREGRINKGKGRATLEQEEQ
jgi:hypothetical protein